MPLGLYISIPFCRSKCTFCNFASGVFPRELLERYVAHLEREPSRAQQIAAAARGHLEREVDSVYLGGGTPSILAPEQLERIFRAMRATFDLQPGSEVTVECAPGTLTPEMLDALARCGVNRVSLGVQSFIDQEARAVGRLHTREVALHDIDHLRQAGISEISIDLIAGLPHQSEQSWRYTLAETIATGVPHVSVYMLEVDEDSRLGRELMAGGTRYHAHHVPDEELTVDLYTLAIEELNASGLRQYEISNFARDEHTASSVDSCAFPAHASRHNLKYWLRQPYLGFGVDAHSMLPAAAPGSSHAAVRLATVDELEPLLAGAAPQVTVIDERAALEEMWFLGLRLNHGVEPGRIEREFGARAEPYRAVLSELQTLGLLTLENGFARLTARGRLLSNEVFVRFLLGQKAPPHVVSS